MTFIELQFFAGHQGSEIRGSPVGSDSKEYAYNVEVLGLNPGLGRSPPGERAGYLLQYSSLQNSMVRGAWQATVHGVAKSLTRLSD